MKKAFTLVEVVVVMAVIAVIASLVIGAIVAVRRTQEETVHRNNARTIIAGLETFYSKHKAYCKTGTSLECGLTKSFLSVSEGLETEGIDIELVSTKCDPVTMIRLIPSVLASQNQYADWEGGGKVDFTDSQSVVVKIVDSTCLGYDFVEEVQIP